jgi:hypothetical protein
MTPMWHQNDDNWIPSQYTNIYHIFFNPSKKCIHFVLNTQISFKLNQLYDNVIFFIELIFVF